jgi:hypothetical protein
MEFHPVNTFGRSKVLNCPADSVAEIAVGKKSDILDQKE